MKTFYHFLVVLLIPLFLAYSSSSVYAEEKITPYTPEEIGTEPVEIIKPKKEYLKQISRFSLRHLHSIIFDQLLLAIANYYTKEQAGDLLSEFNNVAICQPPNKNGWIVRGKKIV